MLNIERQGLTDRRRIKLTRVLTTSARKSAAHRLNKDRDEIAGARDFTSLFTIDNLVKDPPICSELIVSADHSLQRSLRT